MTFEDLKSIIDAMSDEERNRPVEVYFDECGYIRVNIAEDQAGNAFFITAREDD